MDLPRYPGGSDLSIGAPPRPRSPAALAAGGQSLAAALVWVCRGLALVCGMFFLAVAVATLGTAQKAGVAAVLAALTLALQGVVPLAVLLAVAEGLRLVLAIERNTRGGTQQGGAPEARS